LTFLVLGRNNTNHFRKLLIEETARRYLDSGFTHWEFVRGKLRLDPVYLELLAKGTLAREGRLLDLGCGRGILIALIDTCRQLRDTELCSGKWDAPPPGLELHGIEGRPATVAVAQQALHGKATVEQGDLRTLEVPSASTVVLLDVLHYLAEEEQDCLLQRVTHSLSPDGLLIIREVDATPSWRYGITALTERMRSLIRGHLWQRFCYRSTTEWVARLQGLGYTVAVEPMNRRTPFANVLFLARQEGP
jgi:trans-aconitate methyltransferase